MPSPELGPRGGKYPHHVTQSILVPKDRKDVRGDADRARVVAERYGARPGGKVAEQENFFAFRQVNPDRIKPGTYISFKVPNSGVVLRKGLPIDSARGNPAAVPGETFRVFPHYITLDSTRGSHDATLEYNHHSDPAKSSLYLAVTVGGKTTYATDLDWHGHPIASQNRWGSSTSSVGAQDVFSAHLPQMFDRFKQLVRTDPAALKVMGLRDHMRLTQSAHDTQSDSARDNPSSDNNGIWWAVGAAAVVFIGAGLLAARSANAAIAPNPNTPVPTPTPRQPTTPTVHGVTFARVTQPVGFSPYSPAAIRVLQQQLFNLGYEITAVDGIYGPETEAAVDFFIVDAGLAPDTGGLQIMLAVDTRYTHVFGA